MFYRYIQYKPYTMSRPKTLLDMLSHAERVVAAVESDKLGLEEDIAPNLEIGRGRLDATKTSCDKSVSR